MWICLASLLRPGSWSVSICGDSIVLTSRSLAFISLSIIEGVVLGMACLDRFIFVPESVVSGILVLVVLGGVSI